MYNVLKTIPRLMPMHPLLRLVQKVMAHIYKLTPIFDMQVLRPPNVEPCPKEPRRRPPPARPRGLLGGTLLQRRVSSAHLPGEGTGKPQETLKATSELFFSLHVKPALTILIIEPLSNNFS